MTSSGRTRSKKNIDLELNQESDLPDVLIDSERIQQAVSGILSNAIKFTPKRVQNEDGSPKENKVSVTVSKSRFGIDIMMSDNGPGIPKDALNRIFKMGERAIADEVEGHGIGLAVHKAIILAHGGKISVESRGGPAPHS